MRRRWRGCLRKEISRKKPNLKNRVSQEIEEAVKQIAVDYPAYGQLRVSNELKKKGIFVSQGGVRGIWLRYDLETFAKRLRLLEDKMAKENFILIPKLELIALEKKKEKQEATGVMET